MRAYSIFVCNVDNDNSVEILSSCFSLSRFSYFERNYIKEIFKFIVRSITPKLKPGIQEIITHDEFTVFSYKWNDGLSIFMICDSDFPTRIAFSSIFEAYIHIRDQNQQEIFSTEENKKMYKAINTILNKYKPLISDAIIESQIKIDKAREAINVSLKSFLDRGENLDELIQKSNDLSESSKKLFKMSKKTKRPCCSLQ
ncbi:SNARE protein [Cryptosporidium ubiquitum]|uniref:SNARE protein n=1 Tax=Cryptosporidium ubiquitum TaxID=857276 RepID=A0A1J4MMN1_9CRYT|nr:SNARE protein [Cryptosporidium ubiquitum]OII75303.1 SNARE protein [Cryptosporidium ubiquitum]